MILLDHNSTGDGLMTACQFLAAVIRSGKPVGRSHPGHGEDAADPD